MKRSLKFRLVRTRRQTVTVTAEVPDTYCPSCGRELAAPGEAQGLEVAGLEEEETALDDPAAGLVDVNSNSLRA